MNYIGWSEFDHTQLSTMNAMRPRHLLLVLVVVGIASSIAACGNLDSGIGAADPGLYWTWGCPEGGMPLDASSPVEYLASGSCGPGGPFSLSVDGCEMSGTWSALGLSNVQTDQYTATPGDGGWIVTATPETEDGGTPDGGLTWTCAATAAASAELIVTC